MSQARRTVLLIPCLASTCRYSVNWPPGSSQTGYDSPSVASPSELSELQQRTRSLMFQGIASTARQTYASAQRKFLEFCQWINAAPLPASEWTLMLFGHTCLKPLKQPLSKSTYPAYARSTSKMVSRTHSRTVYDWKESYGVSKGLKVFLNGNGSRLL